jgi:hypothetical protein
MKNLMISIFAVLFAAIMGMCNQLYILSEEQHAGYLYAAIASGTVTMVLLIYLLAEWMSQK